MSIHSFLISLFVVSAFCSEAHAVTWEKPAQPAAFNHLISLTHHPADPSRVFIASKNQIYEQLTDGNWSPVWNSSGQAVEILQVYSSNQHPDSLFVLTSSGAFRLDLQSSEIFRFFHSFSPAERTIYSFTVLPEDPDHWLLGTAESLWESDDAGRSWHRSYRFRSSAIPLLTFSAGKLFVATDNRLYLSNNLTDFQPAFSLLSGHASEFLELEEELEEQGISKKVPDFSDLASAGNTGSFLWIGTTHGVFESQDDGKRWQRISRSGLRSDHILRLIYSERSHQLFAGSSRGVYTYDRLNGKWKELYAGLDTTRIYDLKLIPGTPEKLAAVTGTGFLTYDIVPAVMNEPSIWKPSAEKSRLFHDLIRLEPSPKELHHQAIRYANLGNGKIKRWHAQSRIKALFPGLSFGRDYNEGNNIDLDRGSSSDPDRYISGPADIDEGWDLDISWDLGDLIWSSAQTSIDSRQKLMVELRNDLLSDLTRIYYERRRLQMESVFSPSFSQQDHFERQIRLEELTSLIDAMTDGYLSLRLQEIYRQHPELIQLWDYTNLSEGEIL